MDTLKEVANEISTRIQNGEKLKNLGYIINEYNGTDWKKYCKFCNFEYKRNHVFQNNIIDIYVICWSENQNSGIHDHPDNGCLVKVMKGNLIEREYHKENLENVLNEIHAFEGDISYQEGSNKLHSIVNNNIKTVTLHIYSPPKFKSTFYST